MFKVILFYGLVIIRHKLFGHDIILKIIQGEILWLENQQITLMSLKSK